MRNLSKGPQKSPNILKILTFTILFAVFTFALIRLVGIDKLVFKGPKAVVQLITDTGLNSNNGRVNVLLLGIGGQGHEGPNLSDTMILASIAEDGHDVVLVSIPRDLWDPSLSTKVNSVYAYG
ncbi:MAG: Cell envelope-related transcriptional attenuator, partial [Candidatus Curtissbacteria bacterium GW2011_GWA2_41_24]